jgi:hypothetical protein
MNLLYVLFLVNALVVGVLSSFPRITKSIGDYRLTNRYQVTLGRALGFLLAVLAAMNIYLVFMGG